MNLSISGHHVEVTPALREYVTTKLRRIRHHFDQVIDVNVILSVEKLVQRDCDRTLQWLAQGRTGGSRSRDAVIIGGFAGWGQPGRVRPWGVRRPPWCGKGWACKRFPFGFSGLRCFREGAGDRCWRGLGAVQPGRARGAPG